MKDEDIKLTRPKIEFWLVILSLIISAAVGYTSLQNRVSANTEATEDNTVNIKALEGCIQQQNIDSITIKSDLAHIKEKVDTIEKKID